MQHFATNKSVSHHLNKLHSSVVRAPVFQSDIHAFEHWAGTDIYVPAMLRSEYLLANKGYARHKFITDAFLFPLGTLDKLHSLM